MRPSPHHPLVPVSVSRRSAAGGCAHAQHTRSKDGEQRAGHGECITHGCSSSPRAVVQEQCTAAVLLARHKQLRLQHQHQVASGRRPGRGLRGGRSVPIGLSRFGGSRGGLGVCPAGTPPALPARRITALLWVGRGGDGRGGGSVVAGGESAGGASPVEEAEACRAVASRGGRYRADFSQPNDISIL